MILAFLRALKARNFLNWNGQYGTFRTILVDTKQLPQFNVGQHFTVSGVNRTTGMVYLEHK